MKQRKDDGGPAFGGAYDQVLANDVSTAKIEVRVRGISVRDYFAAAALTGYMANGWRPNAYAKLSIADSMYAIAEDMLKAKEKP